MSLLSKVAVAAVVCAMLFLGHLALWAEPERHAEASSIQAAATAWSEAFGRDDLDALVGMYTENAKLLPEGSDGLAGHGAIREFFQKMKSAQPGHTIRFSNFEFYGSAPEVTECSEFEIRDRAGTPVLRGKQVLIRMKQNGQWKIHRDIWTGSDPSPSQ